VFCVYGIGASLMRGVSRMFVRRATISDAGSIASIDVLAWQEAYRGVVPDEYLDGLSIAQSESQWIKRLNAGESEVFVAEDSHRVIGRVHLGATRDENAPLRTGEIYGVNVLPSRWSMGAGRALCRYAQQRLVELGFSRVTLWVLTGNDRAIRLYQHLGFSAGPEAYIEIGGKSLPKVRYEIAVG
jgi:ribosomal protein S18 acetylase RimI-like enzyme